MGNTTSNRNNQEGRRTTPAPVESPVRGELVGLAEAARILCVSKRTLQYWCDSPTKRFPVYADTTRRFDTADLYDYLRSIRIGPTK